MVHSCAAGAVRETLARSCLAACPKPLCPASTSAKWVLDLTRRTFIEGAWQGATVVKGPRTAQGAQVLVAAGNAAQCYTHRKNTGFQARDMVPWQCDYLTCASPWL